MGFLPPSLAEATAKDKAAGHYERAVPGDYTYLVKEVSYEEVQLKKGGKGNVLFIRQRVFESRPHPKGQPAGVIPHPPGTDVDVYIPHYGDAAVFMTKKYKAWALGLMGLDEKKCDEKELARTLALIGGPEQIARGMLIRGITFSRPNKEEDGEDFIEHDWSAVAGENIPTAASVVERRRALDAEKADKPFAAAGGASTASVPAASTTVTVPAAAAIPGIPDAAPAIPGIPDAAPDPMAGWTKHPASPPGRPQYYMREGLKSAYTEEEIRAGKINRG